MKTPPNLPGSGRTRFPVERMLRIHQAIQKGDYPNASTIARELEVSSKSIHRDIEFMRDRLELPVEFDPKRNGYFYSSDVSAFPTLHISEGELFALLVAEKALQQYRGTHFEKPLLSAIRKLEASLPDTVTLNLEDWDRTISFRTSAEPLLDLEIFRALAKAAAARRRIEIQYRKPGGSAPETRRVDPYVLSNINGEWFLFAFDHLRKAIRTFVPSRIKSITQTSETFSVPRGFSLEKELRSSFGVLTGKGDYKVVIRFDPAVADYIREKRWHISQSVHEIPGGGIDLHLQLSSLEEVSRWILGWGGKAIPIAPPELVETVSNSARQILAQTRPVKS